MSKPPPFPILLAIDPSVNRLGWAAVNLNVPGERYEVTSAMWRFGFVHPRARELGAANIWASIFAQLRGSCGDWRPTHLAIEWPAFFGSERGRRAARCARARA